MVFQISSLHALKMALSDFGTQMIIQFLLDALFQLFQEYIQIVLHLLMKLLYLDGLMLVFAHSVLKDLNHFGK